MFRILIGAVALLSPVASTAQDGGPPIAERTAARAAEAAMKDGRYLDAAEVLRPFAVDAEGKPATGLGGQMWRQYDGWVRGGVPAMTTNAEPLPLADATHLAKADLRDAIAEIVARAKKTRIVMLNEDHGSPRSRAFALEVARALRPLGYDMLAVETLGNVADDAASAAAMQRVVQDGYIRRGTGYYSKEPVFAGFLRGALALGYRPVAYEVTGDPGEASREERFTQREEAQATYLAHRALEAHPQSKLLVYVGFSHLTEAPIKDYDEKPQRWMATRLKALTGIDPLTIDQTVMIEDPTFARSAGFGIVADRIAAGKVPGRSVVPFVAGKPLVIGDYAGAVDLQVVHPRTRLVDGRPDWLRGMGRTPVTVPQNLLPTRGTRLVQAFVAGEAADAVPVDQVLVTAGKRPPALMLPSGPVRYAVQDPAAAK